MGFVTGYAGRGSRRVENETAASLDAATKEEGMRNGYA